MTDFNKLKVVELRKLLKDYNLPSTGTKPDLISRLEALNDTKKSSAVEKTQANPDTLLEEDATVTSTISTIIPKVSAPPKIEKITMGDSAVNGQLENRIKRFGTITNDAKKTLREQRFVTGASKTVVKENAKQDGEVILKARSDRFNTASNLLKPINETKDSNEILTKRANRFGIDKSTTANVTTTIKNTSSASTGQDILAKRASRFASATSSSSSSSALPAASTDKTSAVLKRKERFGIIIGPTDVSEEKKLKRMERFGQK